MDQPRPDDQAGPTGPTGPGDPSSSLDLESLRRKVASQPAIEQAKGMLMGYYGIDEDQAFALLRRWSSTRHVKLRDLCRVVVDAGGSPGPEPYAGLRGLLDDAELGPRGPG